MSHNRLVHGLISALICVTFVLNAGQAAAVPAPGDVHQPARAQSYPDWLTADAASQLAVGIDVLVPWTLPAPFSGLPQISASSGYYSLYWFVGGDAPTLLQIIGTAGGSIPAYSKYDRNVELTANASVNGNTAYHDLTPIYDLVYWQVGNVVYSVESQNSSVDSISLASSLTVLQVPDQGPPPVTGSLTSPDQIGEGEIGNVNVSVNGEGILATDVGVFTANGSASIGVSGDTVVEWQAPQLDQSVTANFSLLDAADGSLINSTPTLVIAQESDPGSDEATADWALACPTIAQNGTTVTLTAEGSGQATLSASDGTLGSGSPAIVLNISGSVDVEFNAPFDGTGTVLLTLANEQEAVATCEIDLTDEEVATVETTELPAGTFPGDGTDLSVGIGEEPTLPAGFGSPIAASPIDPVTHPGDGTGMMEANQVTPPTVAPTVTPTPTLKPGDPTLTPVPTETVAPTLTPTPENPIPTMVPQVTNNGNLVAKEIGPIGGELTSSDLGVRIEVQEGAFEDMTSVTLQPVPDNQVPLQAGLSLVPDSAFDISFAQLNGRAVDLGDNSAKVQVDLGERWRDNATLYQLVNGQATALNGVRTSGSTLEIEIDGPMRLVAGVPAASAASTDRGLVPFVLIALAAVIVLIVAGSVLTSLRGRRLRPVPTRRTSSHRGRL
jgi:hypothetical protein